MSPRKFVVPLSAVLMGSGLAVLGAAPAARADLTTADAATALDLPAGVTITQLSGDPTSRAVADVGLDQNVEFNDFPSKGDSYVLLSTGNAGKVFEGTPTSQLSTDFGDDFAPDTSSLTLTVAQGTALPGGTTVGCLFVDFAMGTEEALGYTESVPDDVLSIASRDSEYAQNAGEGYFGQNVDADPDRDWPEDIDEPYEVNQIDYWHQPGNPLDPVPGTAETPRLPTVTGLNHLTTRDTAWVPLDVVSGAQTIEVAVRDTPEAPNGDLDTVAFVDNVRLGASCGHGTGVEPYPATQESPSACCGVIRGIRGVGNALYYDPVPSTDVVEMYDDVRVPGDCGVGVPDHECGNGWRSPSNKPVELRFRWYRTLSTNRNDGNMTKWTAIPHADRQSYVPTSVDRGKVLIVLVTGVVDGRRVETFPSTNNASTWYVTGTIDYGTFVSDVVPEVNDSNGGSVAVGDLLTAQIGDMVPRQDSYEWQWLYKAPSSTFWSAIEGATDQEYVVGEALAGKMISVRATAKRDQFDDKSGTDPQGVGPVTYLDWQASPTPAIVHDGTPKYGESVTADVGEWLPTPTSHSYQWKRNGAIIPGATQASYKLTTNDVGVQLTVDVSGVRTGYGPALKTSAPVVPSGETMVGAQPTISGTAKVGEKLTGAATGWSPSGSTLTWAWYAGDTLLQSGNRAYVTIPPSAAGKRIVLRVTGTEPGYDPLTMTAQTAVVAPGTLVVGSPRIGGVPRVGSTLTAYAGYWGPRGVRLGYRWKVGSRVVAGPAGARSTFRVPRTARRKRITVTVTGSLAGYATVRRTSAPTPRISR